MRFEIVAIAVVVGACIWALRVLPMRFDLSRMPQTGVLARFVAATGVAAIATLFAASVMPEFASGRAGPALMGSLAVVAVYLASKSVVVSTMAGAAIYGAALAILG